MVSKRQGIYSNGHADVPCIVKRIGSQNTRIILSDGTETLVASELVKVQDEKNVIRDSSGRLIPTIPIERFYRSLRKLTGSKDAKFQSLHKLLNERHGPKGSVFVSELFRRSVLHAECYSNTEEGFYPERMSRQLNESKFAKRFVEIMSRSGPLRLGNRTVAFLDYEVYPFRTTYSCLESGKSASRSGSGGMDLLLATDSNGVLPTIGEIKAATETVGPTFALIQSLMYAAQICTRNQFLRLKRHYPNAFNTIKDDHPKVDLIIFLEVESSLNDADLRYALNLADELVRPLTTYLRHVLFMRCSIESDQIKCESLSPE